MSDMIVIYSYLTRLPLYTVEPPFTDDTIDFYETLYPTNSGDIRSTIVALDTIADKYMVGEDNATMEDRPYQDVTAEDTSIEDEDNPGNYFAGKHIICPTLGPDHIYTIIIDNDNVYTSEDAEFDIYFRTAGTYHVVVRNFPWYDAVFDWTF